MTDQADALLHQAVGEAQSHDMTAFQKDAAAIFTRDKNDPSKLQQDAALLHQYVANDVLKRLNFPDTKLDHAPEQQFQFDYGRNRKVSYDDKGNVTQVADSGSATPHEGMHWSDQMLLWKKSEDGKGMAGYTKDEHGAWTQNSADLYNFTVLKDGSLSFSNNPDLKTMIVLHPNGDMTMSAKNDGIARSVTYKSQDQTITESKFPDGTAVTIDGRFKPIKGRTDGMQELVPDKITINSGGGSVELLRGANGEISKTTIDAQGHKATEKLPSDFDMKEYGKFIDNAKELNIVWLKSDKNGPHCELISDQNSVWDWGRRMKREMLDWLK